MRPFFIILLFILVLFLASGCRSEGSVRSAFALAPRAKVTIGHIENRARALRAFPVDNFADMLEFTLLERGFAIGDFDPELLGDEEPEKTSAQIPAPTPPPEILSEKTARETEYFRESEPDLFPPYFRALAGEATAAPLTFGGSRLLSAREIERLSKKAPFDIFIQGAVGTSDRTFGGLESEEEEDALIFLKIFGPNGARIGAVTFTVEEREYSRPDFLREICARIAGEFERLAPPPGPPQSSASPESQPEASNQNPPEPAVVP